MVLALGTAALMLMMLLSMLALPHLKRVLDLALRRLSERAQHKRLTLVEEYDPGRELRAEQRARALLRSCVNEEDWAMYCELGFLRVRGTLEARAYAYLVYPHKPILAYVPSTNHMLGEYCIEFPDRTRPYGSTRLPDSDDVLAKWMALTADEHALIEQANMHLAGRQIRVAKAKRDLVRLACWERERMESHRRAPRRAGSVPAL
ncbi:MAG TPA: hypothetical protein VGP18_02770 [Solirubrobacteraceae bacterium]|nr:hypothetical protein [Solirubrobacteraceae bacterium]